MTVPVGVLAAGSAVAGLLVIPGVWHPFEDWLDARRRAARPRVDGQEWLTSAIAVDARRARQPARVARVRRAAASSSRTARVRTTLEHKLWFDEAVRRAVLAAGAGDRRAAPRPVRDAGRPGRPRRGRRGDAARRRGHVERAERAAAHLRPRDHGLGRRPDPRLPGGALDADDAADRRPARRRAARLGRCRCRASRRAASRCSPRSPRSGSGSGSIRNFEFASDAQQYSASREWFDELGISYAVGLYGFQYWLVGLTIVVGACAIGYGAWVGRERAARVLRPDALPRRRARRRLRRAGPDPLLRLLRGDADPDLRARRRLGRAGPGEGDGHVRALHDGRLAADARVDRRVRDLAGHVPARRDRDELERLGVPRLPRRVRGQGAAAAVPRLAPRRVHGGAARGRGAPLRGRLEGRGLRARLDRAARTSPSRSRTSARSSSSSPPRRSSTAPCSRSASRTSAA